MAFLVAPRLGAFIERKNAEMQRLHHKSHLALVRVLKVPVQLSFLAPVSRTLHGAFIDNQIGKNQIVPGRERVLTNGECLVFVNRAFAPNWVRLLKVNLVTVDTTNDVAPCVCAFIESFASSNQRLPHESHLVWVHILKA